MKRLIYIFIVLISIAGCGKEEEYLFKDVARVQFLASGDKEPEDVVYSFVWLGKDKIRDTVYLPLRILGGPSEIDRQLKVVQVEEYDIKYEYDNKGYVVDSTVSPIENKAIPGVHYVAFDDPETKTLMKVRANHVIDSLPVILLRDASLAERKVRLRIKLESSDDFQLGERKCLLRTVVFSDKLEKPEAWNWTTKSYLGEYSVPKHELMIRVVRALMGDEYQVDNAWIENGNNEVATFVFWRGKFIEELNAFNQDPENIASGKAPLRVDPENPNSALVSFPANV